MSAPAFPIAAAATLFIERQQLDRPRGRRLNATTLARLAEDTGGLQIDSINVVERGHLLTLWSRFGPFDRARFERLVYRDRVLFEYMAHVACFVPASHLPAWRRVMLTLRERGSFTASWLKNNAAVVKATLEAVRREGPRGSSDFAHRRPGGLGGWWSWKPTTHGLVRLWLSGQLLVTGRERFEKRYDLFERYAPEWADVPPLERDAFDRWHVAQSLHSMGAATETDLRMYLTWPRTPAARRRAALTSMLQAGEVVEVAIGDAARPRWFALARDLPALAAARRRVPATGATLLSPFDSFLWHRERTRRLFGYDYRLEVYTPGHQRTHGYYTLPLYHAGQLVGRVDLKLHRAAGVLEARRVHVEPWVVAGQAPPVWGAPIALEAVCAGLADSLQSLATFTGAARVRVGRVAPGRLRAPVRRALRELVPAEPA